MTRDMEDTKKRKRGEAEEDDNVSKEVMSEENSMGSQRTRPRSEDSMSKDKQESPRQLLPSASQVHPVPHLCYMDIDY